MFTNVNINPISPASGPAGQLGDKFPASHKVHDAEVTSQLHPTDTGHDLFVLKCHVECLRRLAAIWLKLLASFQNIVGKILGEITTFNNKGCYFSNFLS